MTDKTPEELQAEIDRLNGELTTVNANAAKLVKEKRDALTRAETAEQAVEDAATGKLDDLAKAQREITRLTNEIQSANEKATASDKTLRDYKLTNALNEAMSTNNVEDGHRSLLSKALRGDVEFDDDGEPTINGKSVADYTKAFFAKEGKSYVRPADHSGSGATGSTTATVQSKLSKRPTTPAELDILDAMPTAERNAWCDANNCQDLKPI